MKNKLIAFVLTLLFASSALAKVDPTSIPSTAVEESFITIKGKGFNSGANPFAAKVLTADGTTVTLPVDVTDSKKGKVFLPSIPESSSGFIQLTLQISGGNVASGSPENFPIVLVKRSVNAPTSLDPGTVASLPELPSTVSDGIGIQGPQGPAGPQGETGPAGAQGPSGPAGVVPVAIPAGNVVGTVASAAVVTGSNQASITTLPALTSVGSGVAITNFASTVNGAAGFTGNLTGDVTGNLTGDVTGNLTGDVTGDITGSVLTPVQASITTLAGLTAAGTTGVTTTFSGPIAANEGLTGNVAGNLTGQVLTVSQPNITTLAGLTAAGTTGVTTTFSGPVSAPQGVTANLTGNVTGNVTGSAASFTGSLSGDVTGTQSSTAIASSVVLAKTLQAGYAADNGTVATGDTILQAIQNLDGNIIDNNTKIAAINVTLGVPNSANTPNEIVERDGSGNFAANVITANTFSGNLTGLLTTSVQPNIAVAPGLTSIGTSGITTSFSGPVAVPQGITGPMNGTLNGSLNGDVLKPVQNLITTMTGLRRAGTSGFRTTFLGPVNGAEGFIGNLTGNVTGDVTGNVSGTSSSFTSALDGEINGNQLTTKIKAGVVANKKILGVYTAGAGTVANGDTIKEAIQKLDGNVAANTLAIGTNTTNIANLTSALGSPTASNVAGEIVKRDGSGDFAANIITAATFVGNLTGTATNATNAVNATNATNATSATTATTATEANALAGAGTGSLTYTDNNFNTSLVASAATTLNLPAVDGTLATFDVDTSVAGAAIDVTAAGTDVPVAGKNFIKITDSVGTGSIDEFTGGVIGQRLTVMVFGDGPDIVTHIPDGTPDVISLQGNANLTTLGAGDTFEIIFDGTSWLELSRSNN